MSKQRILRIGTRSSDLALWQAEWIAERLDELDIPVEIVHITTQGDVKQGPIGSLGAQGVFTKEIQRALLAEDVDLAVHSLKDLPTEAVEGLELAAVPKRASLRDCLLSRVANSVEELPQGARVGTGSLRRRAQLLHERPDLEMLDIRGNVATRIEKLDDGHFDAIVLAEAGLRRLNLHERITQRLEPHRMLPAVGQGALGLEIRADDDTTREHVLKLVHEPSWLAVIAERAMLRALRGGCLAPIGAWGRVESERLKLDGVVLSADGQQRLAAAAECSLQYEEAVQLGKQVAQDLNDQGADRLVRK